MAGLTKPDFGNSLDLVDIKEIKGNAIILKDGSMRQIVMVAGVNFALKSENEQNIITQAYQMFLNSVDFPLQILVHSRKVNIEKYIDTLMQRKEAEQSPLLRSQIDEYTSFIKGFVEKNAIMEKVFLVVVPFYPTVSIPAKENVSRILPFFGKKKSASDKGPSLEEAEKRERIFQENLAQLEQRTTGIVNGLFQIGLDAVVLGYQQLVELFYNFYNPQTVERRNIPTERSEPQRI